MCSVQLTDCAHPGEKEYVAISKVYQFLYILNNIYRSYFFIYISLFTIVYVLKLNLLLVPFSDILFFSGVSFVNKLN